MPRRARRVPAICYRARPKAAHSVVEFTMNGLRIYLFAHYFGLGAVLPLLAVAFEARGMPPSQYAWVMMLMPLSRLFAPPLWGALADRHLGARTLLRANTALTALAMCVLAAAPGLPALVAAFALWALVSSSIAPLVEASAYRMLGNTASRFGYVRAFGSIGFAASALLLGAFGIDRAVRAPFALAAAAYSVAGVAAWRLAEAPLPKRADLGSALKALATRADVLLLWLGSTLYYVGHGAFDVYFGPHAKSLPGASAATVSTAWSIGAFAEVVCIWYVPRWLTKRSGRALLIGAALIAALRWALLSRVQSSLELLALAPLHGVTFGVWYLALVHENQARAPTEIRATIQGMAQAFVGAGMLTATLAGGYAFELLGGRSLFVGAAGMALMAAACYCARAWLLRDSA